MYMQLFDYMEFFLNQLLVGLGEAHSTHVLFRFFQLIQKELDQSRFVGTIMMDFSKA